MKPSISLGDGVDLELIVALDVGEAVGPAFWFGSSAETAVWSGSGLQLRPVTVVTPGGATGMELNSGENNNYQGSRRSWRRGPETEE